MAHLATTPEAHTIRAAVAQAAFLFFALNLYNSSRAGPASPSLAKLTTEMRLPQLCDQLIPTTRGAKCQDSKCNYKIKI